MARVLKEQRVGTGLQEVETLLRKKKNVILIIFMMVLCILQDGNSCCAEKSGELPCAFLPLTGLPRSGGLPAPGPAAYHKAHSPGTC